MRIWVLKQGWVLVKQEGVVVVSVGMKEEGVGEWIDWEKVERMYVRGKRSMSMCLCSVSLRHVLCR